jgi:AbrB family transcriptional regulator, transcriptional pleiotropic regulator of transition state genes
MNAEIYLLRRVDEHGRIALPVELRRRLNITASDIVGIRFSPEGLVLSKYQTKDSVCCICEQRDDVGEFRNRPICGNCQRQIAHLYPNLVRSK